MGHRYLRSQRGSIIRDFIPPYRRGSLSLWSPLDITGCVLWVRSTLGVTKDGDNLVSNWADQSGNNNDFTATDVPCPLWVDAQQAGYPGIYFDGLADYMISVLTLNQPATMFVVGEMLTTGEPQYLIDGDDGTNRWAFGWNLLGDSKLDIWAGAATQMDYAIDTSVHVYGCIVNNTNSFIWYDNETMVSGTCSTNNVDGITLRSTYNQGAWGKGDTYDVIVYNSALSVANVNTVMTQLMTRYGLS